MNILLSAGLALLSLTGAAAGPIQTPEGELRSFLIEHEKRVQSRDIEYLERVLPADYVYTGPNGRATNREDALAHFRRQRDNPTSRRISLKHNNVTVRVVGDMAFSTHDWIAKTAPPDAAHAEPITDRGRYTGVYEKRNGRWMVIAEHDSEQIYEDDWMVSGVLRASREYSQAIEHPQGGGPEAGARQPQGLAALGRILADEYTATGPDGAFVNKDEARVQYRTSRRVIQRAEHLEQNVRTIGNGIAVETGKARYVGTDAGAAFDTTQRYTRTWALYDGRWQITAEHASAVTSRARD
jgi:ketosteroid isomerase-like protein